MAGETNMTKVVAIPDRWMRLEVVNQCMQFEHVFGELEDDRKAAAKPGYISPASYRTCSCIDQSQSDIYHLCIPPSDSILKQGNRY